jgi:hypothetical protein
VYRVDRNNFYQREKNATIYTPATMSAFLFGLLHPILPQNSLIIDPCVGQGSLLQPFVQAGYTVCGVDIEDQGFAGTMIANYLTLESTDFSQKPSLILMNPPFNVDKKTKEFLKQHYGGRPLLPEVWLQKSIALFGKDVPIAMFTPYGFRLNQTLQSKRWQRFSTGDYPEITSIISLPKDLFEGIQFHSEILLFNLPALKGHYFYQP